MAMSSEFKLFIKTHRIKFLFSFGAGVFVAVVSYSADSSASAWDALLNAMLRGLISGGIALTVNVIIELNTNLQTLKDDFALLKEGVMENDRIILAQKGLSGETGKVMLVAVEEIAVVPDDDLPTPEKLFNVTLPKWLKTFSILRADRLQDLLFSEGYLDHFFSLSDFTQSQLRILVVNNKVRYKESVSRFLQMSEKLGIGTYVYTKSEFYEIRDCLRGLSPALLTSRADRSIFKQNRELLCDIFVGNPELSVAVNSVNELVEYSSLTIPPQSNAELFVLRYERNMQILRRFTSMRTQSASHIAFPIVRSTFTLFDEMTRNGDRKDRNGLARVLSDKAPENLLGAKYIKSLGLNLIQ